MKYILRDIDWFDLEGWQRHLEELRADPEIADREGLMALCEDHIALIRAFEQTPGKRPVEGLSA